MQFNSKYWNDKYKKNHYPWDTGSVTEPIKKYFEQNIDKNIRILIPGAGNANEAAYLHKLGYANVFICDWAKIPLDNFKERNPTFPKDHIVLCDFFNLPGKYDLIIEQTFLSALIPEQLPDYLIKMKNLLNKGGKLIGVIFNDNIPKDGPPFGASKKIYEYYFSNVFNQFSIEKCYNSIKQRDGNEFFIQANH